MIRKKNGSLWFYAPRGVEESIIEYCGEEKRDLLSSFYFMFDLLYTDKFTNHEQNFLDKHGIAKPIKRKRGRIPLVPSDKKFVEYKEDSKLGKLKRSTGYVKLHSDVLQKLLPNKSKYVLDAMKDMGYININSSYVVGSHSKSYQLINHAGFVLTECNDPVLDKRLKKHDEKMFVKFPEVIKNISLNYFSFEFDHYRAKQFIWRYEDPSKENINVVRTTMRYNALKLAEKQYAPSVSSFSGRHFSTFTNLNKKLRKFILLNGETLWDVDVKNCQPLLLVFYYRLYQSVVNDAPPIDTLYENLVLKGELYKYLVDHFYQDEIAAIGFDATRNKVKTELLQYYFSANYVIKHAEYKLARIFEEIFPNVHCFLTIRKTLINHDKKKKGNEDFVIDLQNLEVQLMLEHVAPILLQHNINFIPIHDGILVTKGQTEFVRQTIIDVFEREIQITPQVKINNCINE